jgi:hypothetical protein
MGVHAERILKEFFEIAGIRRAYLAGPARSLGRVGFPGFPLA